MARPNHLPDFTCPPLDEVVLGVQFVPPQGYSSVHSNDVWRLFDKEFPKVQEHPPLEPKFETFGGFNPQPGIQLRVGPPPVRGRLWFISEEGSHLIQFQDDRFLLNWRKRPDDQPYPRFEGIAASFSTYLEQLERHFEEKFSCHIEVNQAEISYINIVPVEEFSQIGDWFSLWGGRQLNIESLATNFSEVIENESGKPFARLTYEIKSVMRIDGKKKALQLSLTFRGIPLGNDKAASMKFIEAGRDKIVTRFSEITTETAHNFWGRQQ